MVRDGVHSAEARTQTIHLSSYPPSAPARYSSVTGTAFLSDIINFPPFPHPPSPPHNLPPYDP